MNVKRVVLLLSLALASSTLVRGASKAVIHPSGAQCNAINWPIIDKEKSYLLGNRLSEDVLINNTFNLGFLAQVMPASGYPIKFLRGQTIETTGNFKPTRWELKDGKLVLKTDEGKHLYGFSYSEVCMALVHEYTFYGSPQLIEIVLVKKAR